jgi:hypothetical protein
MKRLFAFAYRHFVEHDFTVLEARMRASIHLAECSLRRRLSCRRHLANFPATP